VHDVFGLVFSFLSPHDIILGYSRVCKKWRDMFHNSDGLWVRMFEIYFSHIPLDNMSTRPRLPPTRIGREGGDIEGPASSSGFEAWKHWIHLYRSIGVNPVHRKVQGLPQVSLKVASTWALLKTYLKKVLPECDESLSRGATLQDIKDAEKLVGYPLPRCVIELYSVFDGQRNRDGSSIYSQRISRHPYRGVIGGYAVYNDKVSVHMLPLKTAIMMTLKLRRNFPSDAFRTKILLFSSHFKKCFFLDAKDGGLYCGLYKGADVGMQFYKATPNVKKDSILVWLREHARRLLEGEIKVSVIDQAAGNSRGISLYPETPPMMSMAVSNGVVVRSSAVWMPEREMWSYSIRMRLLTKGEQGYVSDVDRKYSTCQLSDRCWVIKSAGDDAKEKNVRGRGVIGMFPILCNSGWILNSESDPHHQYRHAEQLIEGEFVYQSCTPLRNPQKGGSFKGWMTFYRGTERAPAGEPFRVTVSSFPLLIPEFIY